MKTILLKGLERDSVGTSSSKALREAGQVPCVLYGGESQVNFSVYRDDFKNLIYTPNTYLVKLELGDKSYKAIVQEIQFHPVNDSIIHVDFLEVKEDKPVVVSVPTRVTGNSPGVRAGGRLAVKLKKVRIKGMLNDLPDAIDVNINHVELGKSIKIEDIQVNNIELLHAPNIAILTVEATRATRQAANDAAAAAAGKK